MRVAGAVLLSSIAAGLLVAGSLFFAFYGYCEDTCSKPDRTFWGALGAAWPFAFLALAVLTVAVSLLLRRPRVLAAAALSVAFGVLFVAALAGLVALLAALDRADDGGPILIGLALLIPAWDAALVLAARR